MLRGAFLFLSCMLATTFAACGPNRTFDVIVDAPRSEAGTGDVVDAGMDTGIATDAADARSDGGMDARETGSCDFALCDTTCVMVGAPGGTCRDGRCMCFGVMPDSGASESGMRDAPMFESSILTCVLSTDCPPSLFCNGIGCTGPGFCSPRGDPGACGSEGPPSCGCDGRLYTNACVRVSAGVRQGGATTCSAMSDGGGG